LGVGHAAVALASARLAPRVNAGILVFAALLADFLLGIFALAGLEEAHVPSDYASAHYLTFTFPYSHGLLPLLAWGIIFGAIAAIAQTKSRAAAFFVCMLLVVSHFLLDGIVHVAGLPLFPRDSSPTFGLGLWRNMRRELALETLLTIVCVAIYLYFIGRRAPRLTRYGIPLFMAFLTLLTWSELFISLPPQDSQLIFSWLVMPVFFAAIPWVLDRPRVARRIRLYP
jgi:hypothetical protein